MLAVPDLFNGILSEHDRDVLGAARSLADPHGAQVVVLDTAGREIDWGCAGADRVLDVSAMFSDRYRPEPLAELIAAQVTSGAVRHVVLPDTLPGGGDVGRRVAARLAISATSSVVRVESDALICSGDAGTGHWRSTTSRVVMLAAQAAEPVEGRRYAAKPTPIARPSTSDTRIEDAGLIAADSATQPLTEADFILAGGLGISDWAAFHHLAQHLGAAIGGTRPVCDAGLLARERQVGASGLLVEPRCYVAFGISGAPQHLQGIEKCPHVVAVNIDPQAEMLRRADLAIVADAAEVTKALLGLLSERSVQAVRT